VSRIDRRFYRDAIREPIAPTKFATARAALSALPRTLTEARETVRLMVHLRRVGWHASLKPNAVSDDPAPWMNLSAIAVLGAICGDGTAVVEYGSGRSTQWLADLGCRVTSIEHDSDWAQTVRSLLLDSAGRDRCTVVVSDEEGYASTPRRLGVSDVDVVIVDGIDRVACVSEGKHLLSSGGVLVLDDSHRPEYDEAFSLLEEAGFREVTVWGPKFGASGGAPATSFFCKRPEP
jgi:hypothetical protein